MKIGGIQKLSLVDYPGKTCAALFTIGCNMRCGYCHNPELVLPERYTDTIPTDDILTFLATRVGKLEGVTISGGEPTMHEDLPDFIEKVKALGFLIKLDSNGTNPIMLRELFARHLIDYIFALEESLGIKHIPPPTVSSDDTDIAQPAKAEPAPEEKS